MSGVACSGARLVGLANLDLPGLILIPIIAGLVLYLGYAFIVDALWKPFRSGPGSIWCCPLPS
jgi:hypothetical protein